MTKQIGKLKLHCSKRGIAFKWGDGEIHRLSFEGKAKDAAAQSPYDENDDQGYGQNYDQNGYDQAGYDQDYTRSDADSGYDSVDYGTGDGYYDGQAAQPSRYDVLYQSDWIMYALLVLLPPLGIWILWKRGRFSQLVRTIISAVAAIWFIILLIWLFSALFRKVGGQDQINPGAVNTPPPQTVTATVPPAQTGIDTTVQAPVATPRPQGDIDTGTVTPPSGTTTNPDTTTPGTTTAQTVVWATNTSPYFHSTDTCSAITDAERPLLNRVQRSAALARSQTQCEVCVSPDVAGSLPESNTVFWTQNGTYYHKDRTCGNMKNIQTSNVQAANKRGKKPCPKCVGSVYATSGGKYYHVNKSCSGMSGAKLVTVAAAKAAGKKECPVCRANVNKKKSTTAAVYYSTPQGKYYHSKSNCSGMTGAKKVNKATVDKRKQTACPVCVGVTSKSTSQFYATRSGQYYHTKSNCSGMKDASKISLTTAKKEGKKPCPTCVSQSTSASAGTYYATAAGQYYHKTATCSGMKDAKKVTKSAAEKNGKKPCPTCLKDASVRVYATSGGRYYHKTAGCSGMKNAKAISLASAKSSGKTACPTCYKTEAAKTSRYYATRSGKYYHKTATCSGMKNASVVTLATAKARNQKPCPTCLSADTTQYFYATRTGRYFHTKSNCSGMSNASKVTRAAALKAGKTACPVCAASAKNDGPKPAPTPTAKKVYAYASTGSKYYHRNKNCLGLKNAKKVLLSVAKNKGKSACPICVTKQIKKGNLTTSYADKQTVAYASNASAYFHSNKSCVTGLQKTTVQLAKKKGKSACPSCAGNLNTYVYVTRSGTKYHRKATCGGATNAYKISLSTSLRMNYVRCTKCNAPRRK